MLMIKETTIGELLKAYHVRRIKETDALIGQRQLADEFGIEYSVFNKYYNDERAPRDDENKRKLAAKLGDEVYRILGEKPPSPIITAIEELEKSSDPEAIKVRKSIFDLLSSTGWLRTKKVG